jgi:hypothetical protein
MYNSHNVPKDNTDKPQSKNKDTEKDTADIYQYLSVSTLKDLMDHDKSFTFGNSIELTDKILCELENYVDDYVGAWLPLGNEINYNEESSKLLIAQILENICRQCHILTKYKTDIFEINKLIHYQEDNNFKLSECVEYNNTIIDDLPDDKYKDVCKKIYSIHHMAYELLLRINKYTDHYTNQILYDFRNSLTKINDADNTRIHNISKYFNPNYQKIMKNSNTVNNFIVQIDNLFQIINVECKQYLKKIYTDIIAKLASANNINLESLLKTKTT